MSRSWRDPRMWPEEPCALCECESWVRPGPQIVCWDRRPVATCQSRPRARGRNGTAGWISQKNIKANSKNLDRFPSTYTSKWSSFLLIDHKVSEVYTWLTALKVETVLQSSRSIVAERLNQKLSDESVTGFSTLPGNPIWWMYSELALVEIRNWSWNRIKTKKHLKNTKL